MESGYNARMKRGRSGAKDAPGGLVRGTGLTRREALRLGLAGAGLAAFPGSLAAFPGSLHALVLGQEFVQGGANAGSAGPIRIDAHTHIFNARDIAVAGFLRKIGSNADASPFERLMRALLFFLIPDKYEDALTALLHLLAMRAAPTIEDERRALAALKERIDREGFSNAADRRAAFFKAVAEENRLLEEDVDDIVSRALTKLLKNSFTERERNQVVRFMTRLVAMRYQNAARLFELYGQEDGNSLFVSAMVDMSLWLDDDSSLPMEEHFELYSDIARLTGGGLLPFAPFDPWRQAFGGKGGADRGRPLEWVRMAVERYGFAGVKLYPAMGFLPMRNGAHDSDAGKYWPRAARKHKSFGAGLDRALGELYSWCESNGVPVLAHTNSSMAPKRGYAKRGHPREWEKVLKLFPKLRLNLGHFGGWADAKDADGWSRTIAKLMERYDHVYADVGAFDYIDLPKKRRRLTRGLASLVRKHPIVAERLLYASDWYMANSPSYLADFEEVLQSPGLERLREGFFGGNATRYLGLGEGEPNRARLEAHRQGTSPRPSENAGNAIEAIRR